jgi:hypothetical protein
MVLASTLKTRMLSRNFILPEIYGFDKHGDLNEWNFYGRPSWACASDTENEDGVTVLDITEGSRRKRPGWKKDDKIVEIVGKR